MKGRKPVVITEEQIKNAYFDQNVSLKEAAKTIGCAIPTLRKAIKSYGLMAKSCNWNQEAMDKNRYVQPSRIIPKEDLEREYVNHPSNGIRDALAALKTHYTTFAKSMKFHGLVAKKVQRVHKQVGSFYPKLENKEWLQHELETKSKYQVAKDLGCSWGAVHYYTKKHQI